MSHRRAARPLSVIPLRFSPWQYAAAAFAAFALNDCIAFSVLHSRWMNDHSSRVLAGLFVLPPAKGADPLLVSFHVLQAYGFIPWIVAFWAWLGRAPAVLLRQLSAEKVFVGEINNAPVTLEDYREYRFNDNVWTLLYLGSIIVALAIPASQWRNPPGWDIPSRQYAQILLPMDGFVLYLALALILCMVAEAILVLKKVFKQPGVRLCLRPYHPDHVGGLGPLKRYAGRLVWFFAGLGGYLLIDVLQGYRTQQFARDIVLHDFLWAYVFLVPLCFIGSLWFGHLAMVRERDRILLSLLPASADTIPVLSSNPADDSARAKLQLDNIKTMQELRDAVMQFPEWPYDSGNVRHVLTVALGPTLPVIPELLKSAITRLR